MSDCRTRGGEFDPGPVPYFRGDWSWNNFYGHSPLFRWFIQEGLLSVTSESMCTNYWLTTCSSLPRKSVVRWTDRPAMTIAVDLGCKATKQTNKIHSHSLNSSIIQEEKIIFKIIRSTLCLVNSVILYLGLTVFRLSVYLSFHPPIKYCFFLQLIQHSVLPT